jgi:phosphatidylglycerophosphate synthase
VSDLAIALVLAGAAMAALALYAARALLVGRYVSDRAEKMGGSAVLGRWAIDFGYWAARPLVAACARLGVSADALSWASLVLGACGGVSLARGQFGTAALVGAAASALDAIDGQVARLTGTASDAGEVLDAAIDRYTEFFLLGGLAFHYRAAPAAMLLAMAALLGSFMVSYATAKAEALQVPAPRGAMRRHERLVYLLVGALLSAFSVPLIEEGPGRAALGYPMLGALLLIAVVANVSAVRRLAHVARQVRGAGR